MTQNNPGNGKVSLIFSSTMLLVYLGLGYLFIGTSLYIDIWPKPSRTYIGLVLVGWAAFRGFMIWQKYKRLKDEDEK
ncbi:hypothetical protein BH09BAC5_BH09BAC5_00980 [soil metagenome]